MLICKEKLRCPPSSLHPPSFYPQSHIVPPTFHPPSSLHPPFFYPHSHIVSSPTPSDLSFTFPPHLRSIHLPPIRISLPILPSFYRVDECGSDRDAAAAAFDAETAGGSTGRVGSVSPMLRLLGPAETDLQPTFRQFESDFLSIECDVDWR